MELTKICAVCGKAFVTKRPNKRTCSAECSVELERKRTRINNKSHRGVCRECKKEFVGYKGQKFCSVACKNKYIRRNKGKVRCMCRVCGAEFLSEFKTDYCSENCRLIAYNMGVSAAKKERRKSKKRDSLSEYALKARNAGMTYGQYVGQEYIENLKREGKYWCQS